MLNAQKVTCLDTGLIDSWMITVENVAGISMKHHTREISELLDSGIRRNDECCSFRMDTN
jgi:hypothetical protein